MNVNGCHDEINIRVAINFSGIGSYYWNETQWNLSNILV